MRSLLLATLAGLLVGAVGALGYSHYLGEGKQLADLQDQLRAANSSLAKVTQESRESKSETTALSAQVQQLTATKDDLKKQVEELKTSATATSAPAAVPNPLAGMAGIMKTAMAQHTQEQLLLLESRLHLTPDQQAAVKAALDNEAKRAEEMQARMFAGGKIDPQTMADMKNFKSVENAQGHFDPGAEDRLSADENRSAEQCG